MSPTSIVANATQQRRHRRCRLESWRSVQGFDFGSPATYVPALVEDTGMKIVNSLKSLKKRDKNCRIVRRKGRVFIINKANPRYKARQG